MHYLHFIWIKISSRMRWVKERAYPFAHTKRDDSLIFHEFCVYFNPFQCHLSKVLLIHRQSERCNLRKSTWGIRAYINTWKPCQTIWAVHRRRISYDHVYLMILWYDLIGRNAYVASPAWNIRCRLCCGTYNESSLFFYWSKRQNEKRIWKLAEHICRFKLDSLLFLLFYLEWMST